jgi:hypothetical protein
VTLKVATRSAVVATLWLNRDGKSDRTRP